MDSKLPPEILLPGLFPRSYASEQDLQQMQALLMEARACTGDWRYWHVGELMWNFFMVTCHLIPQEHIRLWHNREGRLVGYAILGEDPSFDWQVLPVYEWRGIEAEALAWAESLLGKLRQRDEGVWGGNLLSSARQGDAKRIAFLEKQGFRPVEYTEVNLLRSLDERVPEPTLSAGCRARALAEAGEISNRAAAQREVWHPWTVGKVSAEDYARLMRLPGYEHDLDIVAVAPDGVIAAYVNGWIDPLNRIGDFGPVGTRPAYRRQGLARAALLEGLRRMQARGMERVCVSTGELNTPAIWLYESVGFRIVNKGFQFVRAC